MIPFLFPLSLSRSPSPPLCVFLSPPIATRSLLSLCTALFPLPFLSYTILALFFPLYVLIVFLQNHISFHHVHLGTDDDITDVNPLFFAVKDIGDWRNLCYNLGVGDDVMSPLIHASAPLNQKKRDCLEAYVKGGEATWSKVVKVVANFPISDKLLAKKIARSHGIDWKIINDEL